LGWDDSLIFNKQVRAEIEEKKNLVIKIIWFQYVCSKNTFMIQIKRIISHHIKKNRDIFRFKCF
jgi:diketogulonate reductase-like aldo/keto reductase